MRNWIASFFGVLAACGGGYATSPSAGEVEDALLQYTTQHAATLTVKVRGEIVTKNPFNDGRLGWYDAGVAYYYRPLVHEWVSIMPEAGKETATNVAGHEVCHAISRGHDLLHWNCMSKVAAPTYPYPGTASKEECFGVH